MVQGPRSAVIVQPGRLRLDEGQDTESTGALGPIRAVSRSIAVLQAINRRGSMSVAQIAEAVRLPYPTAYRILFALIHEGLVEREPSRKLYRPTVLVQSLADGYHDHSRLTALAKPSLDALTARTGWPLVLATLAGQDMIIRYATHSMTPMSVSHHYAGFTFPMLDSACGRVCMAFFEDEERHRRLTQLEVGDRPVDVAMLQALRAGQLVEEIRQQGYALRSMPSGGQASDGTWSVAAPVFRYGRVYGAISIVLIEDAVKGQDSEGLYAGEIVQLAHEISANLAFSEAEGESSHLEAGACAT